MLEEKTDIYCKRCKDYFSEDHFNTFKYNKIRGSNFTCKKNKKKNSKYTSKNKYSFDSYEYQRDMALRRMYNFSLEGFLDLLKNQGYCCKICKKEYKKDLKFVVDHCHINGTIRGILCNECNSAIGKLSDNVFLLKSALFYLENPITNQHPNLIKPSDKDKLERLPQGSLNKVLARRRRRLWKEYKMTLEDYDNLLKIQNNCCAICGVNQNSLLTKLNIDHCHKTGKVRGLLCNSCNSGIGFLKDDVELILNAIKYLE